MLFFTYTHPQIKQRVAKAAWEGLSKMAHSKQTVKITPTTVVLSAIGPTPSPRPNSLWSFNSLNSLPLHLTVRAAPNVPPSAQEQLLITELLYCLVGIRGTYIKPEMSQSLDAFQPIKFSIADSVQLSYRDIIQEVNLSIQHTHAQK